MIGTRGAVASFQNLIDAPCFRSRAYSSALRYADDATETLLLAHGQPRQHVGTHPGDGIPDLQAREPFCGHPGEHRVERLQPVGARGSVHHHRQLALAGGRPQRLDHSLAHRPLTVDEPLRRPRRPATERVHPIRQRDG